MFSPALKAWDKCPVMQARAVTLCSVFPETRGSQWPAEGTQHHQVPFWQFKQGLSIPSVIPYEEAFCEHLTHFLKKCAFHLLQK